MPVTLLAVDDSVTMRRVLEMTFAGEDYRVVLADSADAAMALVRSERPAIVLADATLEGKTGYDLCQQIKREMPGILVLVLSSKLHPYDAAKGQAAKVDDHIDKPFDTQQLIDKVRAIVTAPSAQAAQAPQVSPKPPAVAPQQRPVAPATALGARPVPPHGKPTPPPAPVAPAVRAAPPVGARPAAVAQAPVAHTAQARPGAPVAPVAPVPAAAKPAPTATPAVSHPTASVDGDLAKKLAGLGLSREQVDGVLLLSHEVVERVVWEVVPALAEALIKEEIARLTAE